MLQRTRVLQRARECYRGRESVTEGESVLQRARDCSDGLGGGAYMAGVVVLVEVSLTCCYFLGPPSVTSL